MNFNEPVYTTEEVAKRYRVKVDTVQRWVRTGRLSALNLGGTRLGPFGIRLSDLVEFIGEISRGEDPAKEERASANDYYNYWKDDGSAKRVADYIRAFFEKGAL